MRPSAGRMSYILEIGTHPDSRDFSWVDMRNSAAAVVLSVSSWAVADCQSDVIPWPEGSGDLFGSGVAGEAGRIVVGVPNASLGGLFEHGRVLISNTDGFVDLLDIVALLGQWMTTPDGLPDINGDGMVDLADLLLVLDAYGPCEG